MNIERRIYKDLLAWSKSTSRKVLLLRGARQVGKTYLVRRLGESFKNVVEVNFLSDLRVRELFSGNLDSETILEQLAIYYRTSFIDGETLLFFDEIQACPEAITALRFLYEQRPYLHVVAAGSLLEFALKEVSSFGVGRVESLFLNPLTFDEYLGACGEQQLQNLLARCSPQEPPSAVIHERLLSHLRIFMYLGGLPEVVSTFLRERNYQTVEHVIDTLRLSYEDDFAKYRGKVPEARLREVFRSCCLQAGKKFVHSHAYVDANSAQVHVALELLNQAGLVHKVYHSSCSGVPLGAETDLKKFKVLPFDHGIYQRMMGMIPSEIVLDGANLINKGALAEVLVGCSLLNLDGPIQKPALHYWHREAKSSNAEVDYVIQHRNTLIPIEVKAGTKGQMQSMHTYLREKGGRIGIRSSMENFGMLENILIVPLYAILEIPRLLDQYLELS